MSNSSIVFLSFQLIDDVFYCESLVECNITKNTYKVKMEVSDTVRVRDVASCIQAKFDRAEVELFSSIRPEDHLYNERMRLFIGAVKRGERKMSELGQLMKRWGY